VPEKTASYRIAYWITAFLPVLLGFVITFVVLKFIEKKYVPDEDEEKNHKTD